MIQDVIDHIRNRGYMSGVERQKARVKSTGEVFTPTPLCIEIVDNLEANNPELFSDPSKTFLDPSCGDGQLLSEVIIRKIERGSTLEQALSTVYGVDLKMDNVFVCRDRFICGHEELRSIVEKNIVQGNSLRYKYNFPAITDKRRRKERVVLAQQAKDDLEKHLFTY
jgi:hypothetical protein